MKKLLIILMLLPAWAWGGTEVIDPTSDIRLETDWTKLTCPGDAYVCLSDDSDGSQVFITGNTNLGAVFLLGSGTASTADSTIDSVGITMKAKGQNTTYVLPVMVDSVAGQTAGLRAGETITFDVADTWETHETVYTLTPDGNAYTWSDVNSYYIGVENDDNASNYLLQVTELWITVYYSYAEAGGDKHWKILK